MAIRTVHCRIGSLEKIGGLGMCGFSVHCRIGSLEKMLSSCCCAIHVHDRSGSIAKIGFNSRRPLDIQFSIYRVVFDPTAALKVTGQVLSTE